MKRCKTCDYWHGSENGDMINPRKACNRYPAKRGEINPLPSDTHGCGEHSEIREGQSAAPTYIPSPIGVNIIDILKECPEPMDSMNGNCILCKSGAVGGSDSDKLLMHEDTCPWKLARNA